jgi:tRNA 2-thiocytidine biosynthesis protein TtcA
MDGVRNRARRLLARTLERNRLLEPDESFVVAVSGGADSLCLLHLLVDYGRRTQKSWRIIAVHVDPGFENWDSQHIVAACRKLDVDCLVERVDVPDRLRSSGLRPCHVCSRLRRQRLFAVARRLGCRKVLLGHHLEDVGETYLLNLLFTASGATFTLNQGLFQGEILIVRPLYYFDRDLIHRYLRAEGVRPVRNRCPHERAGARAAVRRFMSRLERAEPRVRANLFWGIHNPKPEYLPRPVRRLPDTAEK